MDELSCSFCNLLGLKQKLFSFCNLLELRLLSFFNYKFLQSKNDNNRDALVFLPALHDAYFVLEAKEYTCITMNETTPTIPPFHKCLQFLFTFFSFKLSVSRMCDSAAHCRGGGGFGGGFGRRASATCATEQSVLLSVTVDIGGSGTNLVGGSNGKLDRCYRKEGETAL